MAFQDMAEFVIKFINALTPIIVPLIPVILAIVIKRQNDSAKALTATQQRLGDAQAAIDTHTSENVQLKAQQKINIGRIAELEDDLVVIKASQQATNDENVRLSKQAEQTKRDYDEMAKRLAALQAEYDDFKAKALADKTKSDEDKRADMLIILGLRAELEKAHADAKQAQADARKAQEDATTWHDRAITYESDFQQQGEALAAIRTELDNLRKEIAKKVDTKNLPELPATIENENHVTIPIDKKPEE